MRQCPRCSIIAEDTATFCPHDGTLLDELPGPSSPSEALVGEEVGHYRVTQLLGAGGMGAVYLGVHPTIGSRVAIKVLHPEMARDRDAVRRFFAEARAVNLIRHENIINILDLAELSDGRSYIIMEFLEGESLGTRLRAHGALDPKDAIEIMLPLLAALQAAHERGVIHRDLKPDNVFLTRGGHLKVLDFGIAKLEPLAGESALTQTGAIIGTPMYMSPEQATGRTAEIDCRTDIYSGGILLYEMLSGRVPFKAGTLMELISKHLLEPPPPMRELRPEVPAELEAVVMHALEKERANRFASAAEMAAALRRAAKALGEARAAIPPTRRGPPDEASAPATEVEPQSPPRGARRAVVMGVIAAVLFAGAGLGAWRFLASGRAGGAAAAAARARLDAALALGHEPPAPAACQAQDAATVALLADAASALAGGAPRGARRVDAAALARLEGAPPAAQASAEYWLLLGRARLFVGREPATIGAAAARAVARCPGFAAAHNLAGTAAFVAGRTDEALADYRRAVGLAADYHTPRVNEALVLLRLGRAAEAHAALDQVLAAAPDHAEARLARGQAHLLEGAVERALADLEAAARVEPANATAQLLLGEAYAKAQRAEDAQAAWCRAKALGNARARALCRPAGAPPFGAPADTAATRVTAPAPRGP